MAEAARAATGGGATSGGTLRVSAPVTLAQMYLAGPLRAFLAARPGVRVELVLNAITAVISRRRVRSVTPSSTSLNNARKHRTISLYGLVIDGFSSAAWFGGWSIARTTSTEPPRPTDTPRTMLLRSLWKKHGLIHPRETPQASLRSSNVSPPRSRWS